MTRGNLDWRHGRLPRLPSHDYSSPAGCFLTITVFQRAALFGHCLRGSVRLNEFGLIVEEEWLRSQTLRSEVHLDVFVVMPDHFHGIVLFSPGNTNSVRTDACKDSARFYRPPRSLGSLVAGFKSSTTKRINIVRGMPGARVWQSNYHEQVIRSGKELAAIREYINNNPTRHG
jgi:putative transposase